MRRHTLAPVAIVLAVLMLFAGYMGAYYAMLTATGLENYGPAPAHDRTHAIVRPVYRVRWLWPLLEPAHQVDRRLTPERWRADAW